MSEGVFEKPSKVLCVEPAFDEAESPRPRMPIGKELPVGERRTDPEAGGNAVSPAPAKDSRPQHTAFPQRPLARGTGKHGAFVSGKGWAASPARPTQTQINTLKRTSNGSPARQRQTGNTRG